MVYLKITDLYNITSSVYRGHKAIIKQTEETMKTDIVFFFLFGLRLYVPVNNFSVMLGRSYRFLGITWEVNISCSRIQHSDPSEDRTASSRSGVRRSTTRPARLPKTDIVVPPLILHWKYDNYLFAVVKCVFFSFLSPIF